MERSEERSGAGARGGEGGSLLTRSALACVPYLGTYERTLKFKRADLSVIKFKRAYV